MFKGIKQKTIIPLTRYWGKKTADRISSSPPIVIGGCGRSGTTLLLSILDAHPHIYSIRDQTYAFMGWRRDENGSLAPKRIDRLYRCFILRHIPDSATRWCEKTPMHVRYFGELLDYFGSDIRLIHIIRDGRDVVTSSHPSRPGTYWVPVERWINDVSAGLQYRDHPQVHTLHYEKLVNDFDATMGSLFAFLEETIPDTAGQWMDLTGVRKSRHWHGPVRPLDASSIGRWRDERHRERVREFISNPRATELLFQLGYADATDR